MTDTRTALLDCAQDLIQRVGVNAMSYKDLSSEIGIRKASIHYHFPKKEDLIIAILDRCRESYAERYNAIADSDCDAVGKMYMLVDLFEENLRAGKICVLGMLCVEHESQSEAVEKAIQTATNNSIEVYERIFQQAKKEKLIPENAQTHDMAYGFLCFLLGSQILSRCVQGPDGFRRSAKVYIDALIQ